MVAFWLDWRCRRRQTKFASSVRYWGEFGSLVTAERFEIARKVGKFAKKVTCVWQSNGWNETANQNGLHCRNIVFDSAAGSFPRPKLSICDYPGLLLGLPSFRGPKPLTSTYTPYNASVHFFAAAAAAAFHHYRSFLFSSFFESSAVYESSCV